MYWKFLQYCRDLAARNCLVTINPHDEYRKSTSTEDTLITEYSNKQSTSSYNVFGKYQFDIFLII